MRVLLQRVTKADVRIGDRTGGRIDRGYVLMVGFTHADTADTIEWMVEKILGLRLFADADGKMNLPLAEIGGGVLVVSQFTLYGDAAKGRRPSFLEAARPKVAVPLYEEFLLRLRQRTPVVESGEFGAMMQVSLVNDGPVTLWLQR